MLSWLIESLHVIILELAGGIEKNSLQLPSCKLQPGLWGWDQSSYPPWAFLWLMLWGLVEGFSASADFFAPSKFHSLFQASFPTSHCDLIRQWWRRVSHLLGWIAPGLRFKFSQQSSVSLSMAVSALHTFHTCRTTSSSGCISSAHLSPELTVLTHKSTYPMAQFTPHGINGMVYLEIVA